MTTPRTLLTALLLAAVAASCRRIEPVKIEPHELNLTDWTEKTELYMEYPPLVAGRPALFAVHLTRLDDFRPLTAGNARIEFTALNGRPPTTLTGPQPGRPGAFRVEGAPPAAGQYRWALIVDAPGLSDRHDLGTVTIFADERAADADAGKRPPEDPAAIAYLKEQQWTNDFATARVGEVELRTAIRAPAAIEAMTGGEAVVAAPVAGRFMADELKGVGDHVRAPGEMLGRLEPRVGSGDDRATLAAAVAEAQAATDGARAEQTRAERLLADRAVPARRVEDARRAVAVAEARLRAADARLAQRDETLRTGGGTAAGNAFVLRAPIAGRVADVSATLGASYDQGAPLFIVRTDRVELKAQVPAADAALSRSVTGLALEIPGRADPIVLQPHHIHDAGVIDPVTRALPVQFEVDNPGQLLLVGQTGTAVLYQRGRQRLPAVPKAAILLEAGRPYVFVHAGGERFARRYVEIAARDGDWVGIRSGLKIGDRVVTRGSYDIQLASAAKGLPAEGHVH